LNNHLYKLYVLFIDENEPTYRNPYRKRARLTCMGITPDDVAYDQYHEEIENEQRGIGQAVQDGTAMCGGCASPLTWQRVQRVFHCTTPGCEFQH
jgi:hypothetical protein